MYRYTCALAFSLIACAPLKGVTVNVTAIGKYDPLAWMSDGPDISIHVTNNDPVEHSGILTCVHQDRTYATSIRLTLPPRGEYSAFGQVMLKDLHASPCSFEVTK